MELMRWQFKITIRPITSGKMWLSFLLAYSYTFNFQKEGFTYRLEKTIMPSIHSTTAETICKKSHTWIQIELYLTVDSDRHFIMHRNMNYLPDVILRPDKSERPFWESSQLILWQLLIILDAASSCSIGQNRP